MSARKRKDPDEARDRRRNDEYESDNGFSPFVWGPLLWLFLSIISCNFPCNPSDQDRQHYHDFIKLLGCVLPCGECRRHFDDNLQQAGFGLHVFQSRHTFERFVDCMHQRVAECTKTPPDGVKRDPKTGLWFREDPDTKVRKPVRALPYTFQDMRDTIESFRTQCVHVKGSPKCVAPNGYLASRVVIRIVPREDKKAGPPFAVDPRILRANSRKRTAASEPAAAPQQPTKKQKLKRPAPTRKSSAEENKSSKRRKTLMS